jgi:hypothetical protein
MKYITVPVETKVHLSCHQHWVTKDARWQSPSLRLFSLSLLRTFLSVHHDKKIIESNLKLYNKRVYIDHISTMLIITRFSGGGSWTTMGGQEDSRRRGPGHGTMSARVLSGRVLCSRLDRQKGKKENEPVHVNLMYYVFWWEGKTVQ